MYFFGKTQDNTKKPSENPFFRPYSPVDTLFKPHSTFSLVFLSKIKIHEYCEKEKVILKI